MAKSLDVILYSDTAPDSCLAEIASRIDVDRWAFSFSGYRGSQPFLGRVVGTEFRVHKRRYWHNSFGPILFGRVVSDGRGSRIEAYWGHWRLPILFLRMWLGFAALISVPILYQAIRDILRGKSLAQDNLWLGFVVPLVFALFGWLAPKIGDALSFHERQPIVRFLEAVLSGRKIYVRSIEREWKTSLDGRWG